MKIKNALAVGAGECFYGIVQQGTLNEVSRKQLLSDLSSNGFTIEFCNFIFDVFAYSINQKLAVPEKETSKTSANDSYENIAANTIQNSKKISPNIKTDTKRDKEETVKGKLTFPSGVVYEGELIHKYPNGKGKMIWPDGSTFEGQFLNGRRVNGQFHYPNGVIYEGDFVNGMSEGKGKQTWSDGRDYEGDWLQDKRTGKGKYTWPDGSIYEGDWSNGEMNGKGKIIYASGNSYEGDFTDNQYNGKGKFISLDGEIYEGFYQNNKCQGTGILIKGDGKCYSQIYSQDKLLESRELGFRNRSEVCPCESGKMYKNCHERRL